MQLHCRQHTDFVCDIQEWYGWHFPEMAKIISDNQAYAKVVKAMGFRTNAATTDFSEILPEDLEEVLKAAAVISMGTEISATDLQHIHLLADQVISISQYRTELYTYLTNRMNAIAPNLTALVGELVGARLIAHAGSLMTLAKHPASTIQILGAEKALFRALKTKHDTPKYGLIFHASLVGSAPQKLKGKVSIKAYEVSVIVFCFADYKLLRRWPVWSLPRLPCLFALMLFPMPTPNHLKALLLLVSSTVSSLSHVYVLLSKAWVFRAYAALQLVLP